MCRPVRTSYAKCSLKAFADSLVDKRSVSVTFWVRLVVNVISSPWNCFAILRNLCIPLTNGCCALWSLPSSVSWNFLTWLYSRCTAKYILISWCRPFSYSSSSSFHPSLLPLLSSFLLLQRHLFHRNCLFNYRSVPCV